MLHEPASTTRAAARRQHVQPLLPIDTSWLLVGHGDEFISFVADGSAKGFKMISGSVNAMNALLEEVKKVPVEAGRTNFHRGKWLDPLRVPTSYDEISVEDLLKDSRPFNDTLRQKRLLPIDQRLKLGLNLAEADIIRIPMYFAPPPRTSQRGSRPCYARSPAPIICRSSSAWSSRSARSGRRASYRH